MNAKTNKIQPIAAESLFSLCHIASWNGSFWWATEKSPKIVELPWQGTFIVCVCHSREGCLHHRHSLSLVWFWNAQKGLSSFLSVWESAKEMTVSIAWKWTKHTPQDLCCFLHKLYQFKSLICLCLLEGEEIHYICSSVRYLLIASLPSSLLQLSLLSREKFVYINGWGA